MTARELLARYHAHAGRTVAAFSPWRDPEGHSTYERLVQRAAAMPSTVRVLDLACGDGHLLSRLVDAGFVDLRGVDLSRHELAAARERLGPGVALAHEDAHALSAASGSIDLVTCHMALMLMDPVASVLAEIARVLAPGGALLAIINRPLRDPTYALYRRELYRVTAEAGLPRLRLGDPRTYDASGLQQLVHAQAFEPSVEIDDFEVHVHTTPRRLWSMFELLYDVFRLPAEAQARLRDRVLAAWQPQTGDDDRLGCRMGMRLLACRRRSITHPLAIREASSPVRPADQDL